MSFTLIGFIESDYVLRRMTQPVFSTMVDKCYRFVTEKSPKNSTGNTTELEPRNLSKCLDRLRTVSCLMQSLLSWMDVYNFIAGIQKNYSKGVENGAHDQNRSIQHSFY